MKKISFLFIFLVLSSFVSAEFWLCVNDGDYFSYCNPLTNQNRCGNSDGCTYTNYNEYCMDSYNEGNDCYNQGNWMVCNTVDKSTCSGVGGSGTIDAEPPILTITSPINYTYYNSRAVTVQLNVNELSDFYYIDNIDGRNVWNRLALKVTSYVKMISFKEGINDITIKAIDVMGNFAQKRVIFYVDSEKPKILSILPEDESYANGMFNIEYTERNLQKIELNYQIEGQSWQKVQKTDCPVGDKMECILTIPDLTGEFTLRYYFSITDPATTISSEERTVFIDTTAPNLNVINPPETFTIYDDKNIIWNLTVNEASTIEYMDNNDQKPKFTQLCKDCLTYSKKKSFNDGEHNLIIRATDKAGNTDEVQRSFFVDSKKPKVKKTEPKKGFASGDFYAQIDELNPKTISLNYGNVENGFRNVPLEVGTECVLGSKDYDCNINVDLADYDDSTIQYWFDITDIADSYAESKKLSLDVDTTFPVINNEGEMFSALGRYGYFNISITEKNFDYAEYIDNSVSRPKWTKLCSRLTDESTCEAKKSFSAGPHNIVVHVVDKAGNSISVPIAFDIVY